MALLFAVGVYVYAYRCLAEDGNRSPGEGGTGAERGRADTPTDGESVKRGIGLLLRHARTLLAWAMCTNTCDTRLFLRWTDEEPTATVVVDAENQPLSNTQEERNCLGGVSPEKRGACCSYRAAEENPQMFSYSWHVTARAWSALMRALHGNGAKRKATTAAAPQKKARPRTEPVAGDRIAVWSAPSEELRAARQLVGRAVRRGLPSGDGIDGEVRRAHADGTLWVDLFLDEGGECDELMTVREALGCLTGLPPPRLPRAEAGRWRTGQVVRVTGGEYEEDGPSSTVKYDDGTDLAATHHLRHERWEPFQPTRNYKPECPECAVTMKTCRGDGSANAAGKNPRYMWACPACETTATTQNPCLFSRTDPASPEIHEGPIEVTVLTKGTPQTQNASAAGPPATAPPTGGAKQGKETRHYRRGVTEAPCHQDTIIGYWNVNGASAPGAAKVLARDVATTLADVMCLSEMNLTASHAAALASDMKQRGHRMWYAPHLAQDGRKGTGTAVIAKSTVAAKPGDGIMFARPDGKAMAVALTVGTQPVIMLAAHLPHTDRDRAVFLHDLAEEMIAAKTRQTATHPKWGGAVYMWAADMNMTSHPTLDNETTHEAPTAEAMDALAELNDVMGGARDVYRDIRPRGEEHTHGKVELANRRRLDVMWAGNECLRGESGIVSVGHVSRMEAGYSYVNPATRREVHKTSDHDMVLATLRVTQMRRPKPRPTVRPGTLRVPGVRQAVAALVAGRGQGESAESHMSRVHERTLAACVDHQRARAKAHGRKKAATLTVIGRLQRKVATARREQQPHSQLRHREVLKTERHLMAKERILQRLAHAARRVKDEQEAYEVQMTDAGQGKAARPETRPEPVAELQATRTEGGQAEALVGQEAVTAGFTTFYKGNLATVRRPTEEARADATEVLGRISRETANNLPELVKSGLRIANIISEENIKAAITSLARGSTAGVDGMPLELYMVHIDDIAPALSALYAQLLQRGQLTETMLSAVLSPLYKDKGERTDPTRYRPVSVTTLAYRILAKCIAQRLNCAVTHLVGETQVGFCPGRLYDENVSIVRETIHDVNSSRPADGGMLLFLDNEKAFDRLQHQFMWDTLEAFNLPPDLIAAVKTLYRGANTSVKVNGEVGPAFGLTASVKQGCPLSPLLYVLVQEVQLRMIRDNASIKGVPMPDLDGQITADGPVLRERGLVDDTMVAVRDASSVPHLLDTLSRFEAMSNHKMNIEKTMMLLIGDQRGFDIAGSSAAAEALRARGLTSTYDISAGMQCRLPEKWHGLLLGGEEGAQASWAEATAAATATAQDLQASTMPTGSAGRRAQAIGQVLGRAAATLKFTVPHSQKAVDDGLAAAQKAVDGLVLGKRRWLQAAEATQPRTCMGLGMVDVRRHVAATWVGPLLRTMGSEHALRPFKGYFARQARTAYPEMGMGRELLTLNLSFGRVAGASEATVTGEMRQAFMALAALPPLRYIAPGDDDRATLPRKAMAYDDIVRQPIFFNPIIEKTPMKERATPAQEEEMLRWARQGITRVEHVLNASGTGLATAEDLVARHPGLTGSKYPRGRVTAKLLETAQNLARWEARIASGPPTKVKDGEFWLGEDGTILRAQRTAKRADITVPADVYREEPGVGRIAPTGETRLLRALRVGGTKCHVATLLASDDEDDSGGEDDSMGEEEEVGYRGGGAPRDLADAISREYRHVLLAPAGMAPTPDSRTLAWERPETAEEAKQVGLSGAKTRDVRDTYAAQAWVSPRVFATGGRYAYMVEGLSAGERRKRIRSIAEGMRHQSIPPQEAHHMCVTMHHGHWLGGQKCKGDQALCAQCLRTGTRVEETATHVHHDCATAKAVWELVAGHWHRATGEELDLSSPLQAIAGLRKPPATGCESATAAWKAREPAWRLLHSVTLLQLYRARCRSHAAYHGKEGSSPKKADARAVLTQVRRRMQDRLEFEHRKAVNAEGIAGRRGARALFHTQWVNTGVATMRKQGPRLHIFTRPREEAGGAPVEGTLLIRTGAALVRSTARQGPAAGWSVTVHEVQEDGSEKLHLKASGAVPTRSTHGARAPPQAPTRQTEQAAHQAAAAAALVYARQKTRGGQCRVLITASSETAYRNITERGEPAGRPAARESRVQRARRAAVNGATARKRQREEEEADGVRPYREATQLTQNKNQLRILDCAAPGLVRLRAPGGAQDMALYIAAAKAARMRDLKAHVVTAEGKHRALALWDHSRDWDPGD